MKQPTAELHGEILAGAPFENQRYSRQLSAWYIPLALSGQQWDATARTLTFSPDLRHRHGEAFADGGGGSGGGRAVRVCGDGEPQTFVLPFFFAMPAAGHRGERTAAGHLELPRCTPATASADDSAIRLRLLAGGPLEGVTVSVIDPRATSSDAAATAAAHADDATAQVIVAGPTAVTLLTPGDAAML